MTLLGELYADGLGVPNDDKKAAEWYKLAAARGDREAMFALAMFKMTGRGGPADRAEAARLLAEAAKLGHVVAAYDLALLYLEGQVVPQDFARAAELMRTAADAGNPEAQYALATFYKEGRGVKKDLEEAARLLGARGARRATPMSEVEYGIALFNGTGVAKNESAAADYFLKAAQKSNPIGQNRLALDVRDRPRHQGRPGRSRPLAPDRPGRRRQRSVPRRLHAQHEAHDRAMAENKAKPWIARMNPIGPTPFPTAPPDQTKSQPVKP